MIAGDNGKVGSAHDIVADLNFRSGCEQRCSRAKVHVMAHVDIARSGDLAVTAESHILAACSKGAAQRGH